MRAACALVLFASSSVSADQLWKDVCSQSDVRTLPFCDVSLPLEQRAKDYVKRIATADKSPMMTNGAKGPANLHIPPYQWGSEGLHGPLQPCVCTADQSKCACPSSFPCPSAMGNAMNTTLYHAIGRADGMEARAINNLRNHATQNVYGDGIDYWSPTINLQRDPRWGRNQEVPGEDPHLTSTYATNFVHGLQTGEDDKHVQIVATCKHFIANSLENWEGHTRHNFNAEIAAADLADYYAVPFKACLTPDQGGALGVMCSYNAVNGVPMCANSKWLNETLRNTWGFEGYVTSDCGAVRDVGNKEPGGHGFAKDMPSAAADSLLAGTDVDCGPIYSPNLPTALQRGLIKETDIDLSLYRLTLMQMKLGLFDPKDKQVYFNYGVDIIDSPAHQQLALEAAQQAIVLLKNSETAETAETAASTGGAASPLLPLKAGGKIAVVGPHMNGTDVLISNYHGSRCLNGKPGDGKDFSCIQTPLAAITKANVGGTTTGSAGTTVAGAKVDADFAAAKAAAAAADTVVMVMGLDQSQEREGMDRTISTLPGAQEALLTEILSLRKPTVLVLVHGGAMSLGAFKDSVPAILTAGYGGEAAAQAIADVLFGRYNPSGKLAATWYPSEFLAQLPLTNMNMTVSPGRTHLYYTGTPEFKFGVGLSYTSWELEMATETQAEMAMMAMEGDTALSFEVKLSNTGDRDGAQVVHAFWKPTAAMRKSSTNSRIVALQQKLFAYHKVFLRAGESTTVRFALTHDHLAVADEAGDRYLHAGDYALTFSHGDYGSEKGQLAMPVRVTSANKQPRLMEARSF